MPTHIQQGACSPNLNRAGDAADAFQRYLDLKPDAGNAELVRARTERLRPDATGD
jgi:hypothetical protein